MNRRIMKKKKSVRILCPNGHLGFAPTKEESFFLGVEARPDYYCCDSGSDDIGPAALGRDVSVSPVAWQRHDLELMFLASRRQGVPMIIGSAGDTGTRSRVDLYVKMIAEMAAEHDVPPFRIAWFYSDVEKELLRTMMERGVVVEGLDGRPPLSLEELERTTRIVAVAGVHPFRKALEAGADVIIGGRSSDCAIFAAAALHEGCSPDLAYYLGKVLECASFCAEPYAGKESVLGTIMDDAVYVTAMHPQQRCTVASVAGHAMYERANPFFEHVAGGVLDMRTCRYEQVEEKTCKITGSIFRPDEKGVRVKLEGAGKVGERFIGIAGIRDPYSIAHVDDMIAWARQQVRERLPEEAYHLEYHVYGRNAILKDLESCLDAVPHEVCVVVEGVASDASLAEEVALIGTRQLFYARLPEVKGTAGSVAFLFDEVLPAPPVYSWTLNHVVPVEDPLELFPVFSAQVRKGVLEGEKRL